MRTRPAAIALIAIVSFLVGCVFGGSSLNNENNANNANNANNENNGPNPELCGNGRLDLGEKCDGDCDKFTCPSEGCTIWVTIGTPETCDVECVQNGEQTACGDGDNCCPEGCTEGNDSDCSDECGNGVLDEEELCDPCPDVCEQAECGPPVMQTGDPSTCDLDCQVIGSPPDGCCAGAFCPSPNTCIEGECVPPECEIDEDCREEFGAGATCDNGACVAARGCVESSDCLPWQNCDDAGTCVTPASCEEAMDRRAWCAFHHFTPDQQTYECYDPAGMGDDCTLYMPMYCNTNESCAPWERCAPLDPNASNCGGSVMCACKIPLDCENAKEPDTYCLYMTGDPDAVCDAARDECL